MHGCYPTAISLRPAPSTLDGMPARSLRVALTVAVFVASFVGLSAHRSVGLESPTSSLQPRSTRGANSTAAVVTVASNDQSEAARLYMACMDDAHAVPAEVAVGQGTGPTVGVIGDSLTTQIRPRLLADRSHRWVVWSRCGATVQTALDDDAVRSVRAQHPDVVVVALGTNDAGFPAPREGSSTGFAARVWRLLDQVAGVRCVTWVSAGQIGDRLLQGEMERVNSALHDGGVRIVDWDRMVESEPRLLLDRVHLTTTGADRRTAAISDAVDGC